MRDALKMVFALAIICIVSAGALSFVYYKTEQKIIEVKDAELASMLREVFLSAEKFSLIENDYNEENLISAYSADNLGYVLLVQASGYQGAIKFLVGINNERKITGMRIVEHTETPGLGSRITETSFTGQFEGKNLDNNEYDAITGATVSSSAVINAVKKDVKRIYNLLEGIE